MKPTNFNLQFKNKNAVLREVELTPLEYELLLQGLRSLSTNARKIYDTLMESSFVFFANDYQNYINQIAELHAKLES